MPLAFHALVGLFAALLVNRAADCWFSPAPLACGLTRHPWRARVVVVGLPLAFAWLGARAEPRVALLAGLLAAALVLLAVIDLEQRRLPNAVTLPALVAAVALGDDPAGAAVAAVAAFVVFLGLRALGRRLYGSEALGMGDVKLAALVAAAAGLPVASVALLLGVLLAGGAAAVGVASGRMGREALLPYGAFLALGGVIALLLR